MQSKDNYDQQLILNVQMNYDNYMYSNDQFKQIDQTKIQEEESIEIASFDSADGPQKKKLTHIDEGQPIDFDTNIYIIAVDDITKLESMYLQSKDMKLIKPNKDLKKKLIDKKIIGLKQDIPQPSSGNEPQDQEMDENNDYQMTMDYLCKHRKHFLNMKPSVE